MNSLTNEAVLLEVQGIITSFQVHGERLRAVDGVTLELPRGQKLGIVGESGSGKSALVLSILGLIEPPGYQEAGKVFFEGTDLLSLSDRARSKILGKSIGFIYQDPVAALNPLRTVGDHIVEAILIHQDVSRKIAEEECIGLLKDVEIPSAESRVGAYPHELSGGMQQRVSIAMALANGPSLLVADEPTTALDVTTQAQVLDLLRRLASNLGAAIILVSHDMGVIADFCDEVAVMYAGKVVEQVRRERLSSPAHPYTRELLRSTPRPGGGKRRLPYLPGVPPSLGSAPAGCNFEPRCPVGHGDESCRGREPLLEHVGAQDSVACHYPIDR